MSISTKNQNAIYLNDWSNYKPFQISSPTDTYYLKVSNQILKKLLSEKLVCAPFSKETMKILSIVATCYLEDVVSNFNIFNSFREKHKELYGKNFPFYFEEDYIESEVNFSDVQFLVWYVLTIQEWKEQGEEILVSHESNRLILCSKMIYKIIEEEFEFVPENENFYKINEHFNEDTGIIRGFCWEIAKTNYLYGIGFNRNYAVLQQNLKAFKNHESYAILAYQQEVEFGMKSRSNLLAMDIFEITGRILGKTTPFYEAITAIDPDKYYFTSFKFLKIENGFISLEHISTKKRIKLIEKSFPQTEILTISNCMNIGVVKTIDGWSFCGISSVTTLDSKQIEKICDDEKMTVFDFDEDDKTKNLSQLQEQSTFFKKLHKQSFVIVPKNEVGNFYYNYHNEYYKKFAPIDLLDAIKKEKCNNVLNEMKAFEVDAENDACFYFNPKAGFEIYNDLGECLPINNNPYFKEVKTQDVDDLILNDFYSTEFFNEVVDLYFEKGVYAQNVEFTFTRNEFDFLKRFYSNESYKTKSRLKILDN